MVDRRAPMPCYASAFFWVADAGLLSLVIHGAITTAVAKRRIAAAAFAFGLSPCAVGPIWNEVQRSGNSSDPIETILRANVKLPDPGRWFEATEPLPQMKTFVTSFGLELRVPQGTRGRCWNAPGLCTPSPAPNLRLRDTGRLDRGFTVDGSWQMIDWPEPWRRELLPAMRRGWDKAAQDASK